MKTEERYCAEKRYCWSCEKRTVMANTSANSFPYWYCLECENGKKNQQQEKAQFNHTLKPWPKE